MRTIQRLALVAPLALTLGALAGGCTAAIPDGRYACDTVAECPAGFSCQGDGYCYRSAVDAGEPDLHFDAGPRVDGGPRDGGDSRDGAGPCVCMPDLDPCTDDFCAGGVCTHPPSPPGAPCGDNATCVGSTCTCTAPWARCGTAECSVNTLTSDEHCGTCDISCATMGTTCSGGTCVTCTMASQCDDGVGCTEDACAAGGFCTHVSACGGADTCCGTACVTAGCADMVACTTDACDGIACVHPISAGMCLIGGVCFASGAGNPGNPCQVCNPAAPTVWSPRADGTSCNDGNFCNGDDTCAGGDCQHPGSPCAGTCAGSSCCGQGGQPCCPGEVCSPGRACESGTTCRPCGGAGQICCGSGTRPPGGCNTSLTCNDNGTNNGVCE